MLLGVTKKRKQVFSQNIIYIPDGDTHRFPQLQTTLNLSPKAFPHNTFAFLSAGAIMMNVWK